MNEVDKHTLIVFASTVAWTFFNQLPGWWWTPGLIAAYFFGQSLSRLHTMAGGTQ